jgi:hypothetical protein
MQKKAPPAFANRRCWPINLLSLGFHLKSEYRNSEYRLLQFFDADISEF